MKHIYIFILLIVVLYGCEKNDDNHQNNQYEEQYKAIKGHWVYVTSPSRIIFEFSDSNIIYRTDYIINGKIKEYTGTYSFISKDTLMTSFQGDSISDYFYYNLDSLDNSLILGSRVYKRIMSCNKTCKQLNKEKLIGNWINVHSVDTLSYCLSFTENDSLYEYWNYYGKLDSVKSFKYNIFSEGYLSRSYDSRGKTYTNYYDFVLNHDTLIINEYIIDWVWGSYPKKVKYIKEN